MRVERGKLEDDLRIEDDFTLYGMITGSIVVASDGSLALHGMICRDLILEQRAKVELHGMVCQDVHNRGGDLKVYGIIAGSLYEESGTTFVDPKVVVGRGIVR